MAEPLRSHSPELYVRFRRATTASLHPRPPDGSQAPPGPRSAPQETRSGERPFGLGIGPSSCRSQKARGAVFLDRDGVINNDGDYVNTVDDFVLLPGAAAAIRRLNNAGIPVIVITNQGGVALEYITVDDLDAIHDEMDRQLAMEEAHVDAVYAALAHPDGSVRELRKESPFRKPGSAMLFQAADDLALDLTRSVVVGDTTTDTQAGRSAGCRTVLVRTGFGGKDGRANATPDVVVADLAAAVEWILAGDGQDAARRQG